MFCRKCGKMYADDLRFCPVCGSSLDTTTNGDKMISYDESYTDRQLKRKGIGKVVSIVAACIVVLLLGIGLLDWLLTEDISEDSTVQNEISNVEVNDTLVFYQKLQEEKYSGYPFVMSTSAMSFIADHEEFFPAGRSIVLKNYIDQSAEYKTLNKNVEKYGDSLYKSDAMQVIDIHEENVQDEVCLTTVHVIDEGGNSFIVLYKGELPDIYKDDTVSVCGLPLGISSFENVGGGSTIAVVLAGCRVINTENHKNEDKTNDVVQQTKTAGDTVDYMSCYEPAIEEIAEDSYGEAYYGLYDMNNDGIKELLVDSGEELFFYTVKNGQAYLLGKDELSYCGWYKAEDGNGIYIIYGHMGCEIGFRATMQGEHISLTKEWEIGTCGLNVYYYENNHPIQKYQSGDYSILQNPPEDDKSPVVVDESLDYIFRKSSSQYLTEADLEKLTEWECRIARNEIYARYGRTFTDEALQEYFDTKLWYIGCIAPEDFDDSVLNDYERANLDLIVQYETEQGYR